jgi:hypothetical protein
LSSGGDRHGCNGRYSDRVTGRRINWLRYHIWRGISWRDFISHEAQAIGEAIRAVLNVLM